MELTDIATELHNRIYNMGFRTNVRIKYEVKVNNYNIEK